MFLVGAVIYVGSVCIKAPAKLASDSSPYPFVFVAETTDFTKLFSCKLNGAALKVVIATEQLSGAPTPEQSAVS